MSEMKFSKDHVWVLMEGEIAKVGITEFAQEQFGDILYVDLPSVGDAFAAGEAFTEIESSKAAIEVILPFGGEVVKVNGELEDSPELINENAYDAWIVEMTVEDSALLDALMTKEQYEAAN
jgi:glycine cleavage system H protein